MQAFPVKKGQQGRHALLPHRQYLPLRPLLHPTLPILDH